MIQGRRPPKWSPMSAAPASGTARNSASSQKPAWSDGAIAASHGWYVARMSGCTRASDGVHQPSTRDDRK